MEFKEWKNGQLMDIGRRNVLCSGDMTFKYLTRLSGNGTIFAFTFPSTSITLCNTAFNNCRCESRSGGRIYGSVSGGCTLSLSNICFVSCTSSESGGGISANRNTSMLSVSNSVRFSDRSATIGEYLMVSCVDSPSAANAGNWISTDSEWE